MKFLICFIYLFSSSLHASWNVPSQQKDFSQNPFVTKREFFSLLDLIEKEFQFLAEENNETLTIYGDFDDPQADMAFARRWGTDAHLLIYGGMAYRKELDLDSLALIICHELGHLYGGRPYKTEDAKLSAEGQADFWGAQFCIKRVLPKLPDRNQDHVDQYIHQKCLNDRICIRSYFSILRVGKFLANNWRLPDPQLTTPDPTIVSEINLNHPKPQCRLDTLKNGFENLDRPKCWFYSIQTR